MQELFFAEYIDLYLASPVNKPLLNLAPWTSAMNERAQEGIDDSVHPRLRPGELRSGPGES